MNLTINGLSVTNTSKTWSVSVPTGAGYLSNAIPKITATSLQDLVCLIARHTRQYRCTINALYLSSHCDGYSDLGCRNGEYVEAVSACHARQLMEKKYPQYAKHGFTAELW